MESAVQSPRGAVGKCNSCMYWNRSTNTCHRYPPIITVAGLGSGAASAFPPVAGGNFCGEYVQGTPTRTRYLER